MEIPVNPNVLKDIAEYIGMAQPILDAHPGVVAKVAELEGNIKNLEKNAKARESIDALATLLVESGLLTSDRRDSLVDKLASDAKVAKEVFGNILKARGLNADLGGGVENTVKSSVTSRVGDEFDDFVNK